MLKQLKQYIETNHLFAFGDRVLLAVSGGVDSMVMARLFLESGYTFGIAHCNFSLRGAESDGDEQLVTRFAEANKLPFFTTRFDTKAYAKEHGLSIQMAARELRYTWFEQVCKEHSFQVLATAHNQDDNVETFLLNLSRGTGIRGLCGMLPKNGSIIHPMLFASRTQISAYATEQRVEFREDSSNASDYYARNRIRHNVVPELRLINPSFDATMVENMNRIAQAAALVQQATAELKERAGTQQGDTYKINIEELQKAQLLSLLLFELLQPFGFGASTVQDIEKSLNGQAGKRFYSPQYLLVKDREELIISPLESGEEIEVEIGADTQHVEFPLSMTFEQLPVTTLAELKADSSIALLDVDKLQFPLLLRKWRAGDSFVPFGMRGRKKLSDFLVDIKLSLPEKQHQYVLLSGSDIVWVVGRRIDEGYKLTAATKNVLKVQLTSSPAHQ